MATIVTKPTLIETDKLKFLIMDAPKDSNLHLYIKEMKKHDVVHIARISEPSYSVDEVAKAGITLHVSRNYLSCNFTITIIGYIFLVRK